jgi:protein involved in polysaccharide export with SLBB domain
VTSNYVIGPDDQLRVRIWGQINYSGNLRVDRSGDIYLPQTGTVHVAGLPFSELDQHLRAAVAKMYRNFDLSVDVGQIRSIQIYVTGYAKRPGVYTVSALSSLVDALFSSGGPSPQGSLRHIQIKREGKVVADFDLYALLIHGDKSHDVHLLPEDVLYIAPVGPQAAITGSIAVPGIYELLDGETVGDLIETAGHTSALSSDARISLDRVGPGQVREAMELPLDAKGLAAPLADTDVVRIFPIVASYQKTVTLRGDVANPGRFNWREGMHLSDLIPDRDSLESRDYWWKRSHLGLPSPEFEPLINSLQRDTAQPDPNNSGFASAAGTGLAPSGTAGTNSSELQETLSSALNQVPAEPSKDLTSSGQNGNIGSIATQTLQKQGPGTANQPRRTEVHLAAPEIDWDYAVIERLNPDTLKTSLIPFDLGKLVIGHDSSQDLVLQPGDTITVFSQADIHVPLDQQTKYVDLEGEIVHAGIYSVQSSDTLRDVIRRAGGFTSKAYIYGSEFDRESTRVLQQQRLDEYVRNIGLETERGTQALAVSGSGSGGSPLDVTASHAVGQDLVTRLSQIRATGRIVFALQPGMSSIDDLPAISLENGDRFIIPPQPVTVNVVGSVYDQNSFLYRGPRPVSYYLKLAGGATHDADVHRSFIIRADGSVIGRMTVKNHGAWNRPFEDIRLNAGDTLVVPDKTLRPTALKSFIDWTQIFAQLALGAAAIHSF